MKRLLLGLGLVFVLLLTACGASIADVKKENDRVLAEVKLENNRVIAEIETKRASQQFMDTFVSSLLSSSDYKSYLEWSEEDIEQLATAFMSDAGYVEMLQTTPREDCAQIVVMAIILGGEHFIPSNEEVKEICQWYEDYIKSES